MNYRKFNMNQTGTNLNQYETKQLEISTNLLITDISKLIDEATSRVAREYNIVHIQLSWLIGRRIDEEILQFKSWYKGCIIYSL